MNINEPCPSQTYALILKIPPARSVPGLSETLRNFAGWLHSLFSRYWSLAILKHRRVCSYLFQTFKCRKWNLVSFGPLDPRIFSRPAAWWISLGIWSRRRRKYMTWHCLAGISWNVIFAYFCQSPAFLWLNITIWCSRSTWKKMTIRYSTGFLPYNT